ncbi:EAL domain-containing protein [Belnapia sp. T6]|uniref:EAL domain-containing protein n=1 Tax=Belnapia mucosa TaxID=2804532 RepID=A0ABS1V1W9_9PROT|nr:EAL domain-containing protein [Belnapia mucosa]MBL6455106.1 EAL domain-containing protein [Belnapia mucosa]
MRRRLRADLRGAIRRGEMSLSYQPRIALADGRLTGAEALLRWNHPAHGPIPPATFIPLAEASSLILHLGGWVLREAAREAALWPESAGIVSVNVSARQIEAGLLPAQVAEALAESGLPSDRLELELTETLALEERPETLRMLAALREDGIGLALDDFGIGHASLARLRWLPFTALKLDRSFLAHIPEEREDMAILRAIRDLSHALRIRMVAEGVERDAQRRCLEALDCEEAQGWLFGRPVPAELLRQRWQAPALAG